MPDTTGSIRRQMDGKDEEIGVSLSRHCGRSRREESRRQLSDKHAVGLEHLVMKGVTSVRVVSVGLGEGEPVQPNDTERGRSANRPL
jgi:hypothetical protein